MMVLPFECLNCGNDFETIDEVVVLCPECQSNNIRVDWVEWDKREEG